MKSKKHILRLKRPFEEILKTYSREYLFSDPLKFAHQYEDPQDRELVAFLSSALAYGGVPQIFEILTKVLAKLGDHPAEFMRNFSPHSSQDLFRGLYYRFHKESDFGLLFSLLSQIYRKDGSLAASFKKHFSPDHPDLGPSLAGWMDEILSFDARPYYSSGKIPSEAPIRFFFPSPFQGSSCKRLNLFLRWMVRGPDGLDLGLWNFIPPSRLMIPLDTHIFKIARVLGLTRRKSPNWRMAEEITQHLKVLDPQDPVKYDFALTRLGILGICSPKEFKKFCLDLEPLN
jgi:uncharacterized protein (TIGR02757 family)